MMEINLRLYLTTFPSNSIEVLITIKIFDANNCSHQKKKYSLSCTFLPNLLDSKKWSSALLFTGTSV
uniref:Uncharacterized protein n=1 Tax=Marmota marmota marmota TaxID=9994 RepID=A0A8C5YMC8_MARMA